MWAQLPLQEGAHRVTTTRSRQFAHVAVQQLTLGEGRAVVQRIHERPLTSRLTVVLDGGPVTITNQEQRELRVEAGAGFLHLEETKLEIDVTTPTTVLSLIGSAGEGNREESDVAINGLLSLSASPLISGITGFGLALLADKHPGTSLDARALERSSAWLESWFVNCLPTPRARSGSPSDHPRTSLSSRSSDAMRRNPTARQGASLPSSTSRSGTSNESSSSTGRRCVGRSGMLGSCTPWYVPCFVKGQG
ncbi:hypothetical protein [Pseudoclavibacter helvolus]|uniref:hypothetical protein n=1 Tax=Pseudoclavibacter helvolus TaxID=255205 RepID=UPI00083830D3|nr:hypothetical protein [Pseudoclavibacter helvolus]